MLEILHYSLRFFSAASANDEIVATDSLIATFDVKYFYNVWRPVTAIRKADTDGNPATDADPMWMPLVMTPNFPEYVAGHGSFVSSQAEVFTRFLGTSQIEIDLESSRSSHGHRQSWQWRMLYFHLAIIIV